MQSDGTNGCTSGDQNDYPLQLNLKPLLMKRNGLDHRFSVPSHRRSAQTIRYHRLEAFDTWEIATCLV